MATTTTPTTPRTLLDAINSLLSAVRISPVMSVLASDTNGDVSSAKTALDDAARETLLRGYEFNTEYAYRIDPAADGTVTLPNNTLKLRAVRCNSRRLVKRGLRLYDNVKHTFTIGETVEADVVLALAFEDMPESFKLYVTALAARRWCLPKLPSSATFQYTQEFLQAALSAAEEEDSEGADNTLPDTSPHFAAMRRR
ncbi:hypothetical protein ACQZ6C_10750 [Rhizobium rhizogenes]